MTTLAFNHFTLSDRLFTPSAGGAARTIGQDSYRAIRDLGSSESFAPTKHELYAMHLASVKGELEEPFHPATLNTAAAFLAVYPKHLPQPELSLDSDGEVLFDWSPSAGRMVTVALREDGRISYAATLAGGRTRHGTEFFTDAFPKWLGDLLSELGLQDG